jgi:hypothetical protein
VEIIEEIEVPYERTIIKEIEVPKYVEVDVYEDVEIEVPVERVIEKYVYVDK